MASAFPSSGATLPTSPLAYDPTVLQTKGLDPNNMCILNGFPTALKSKTSFPFGIWFANPTTLYVADEGNGTPVKPPRLSTPPPPLKPLPDCRSGFSIPWPASGKWLTP